MSGVDIIAKLFKLREHLVELPDEERQIVVENLTRHENGSLPLIRDTPRIAWMQVPGEPPLLSPLLQEGTVSVQRKHINDVIWRYMPLEVLFSLLLTEKLHFSPLSCMADANEGELPPETFERAKAQLPLHFQGTTSSITADVVTANLVQHRKHTISLNCWYVGNSENREMWRQYAPNNGVAIQTTVKRLFDALEKHSDTNIHLERVTYFDASEESQYADHAFYGSLFIKHAEPFRKESELRALAPNGRYKNGIDIAVNLPVLLERIVLSPDLRSWAVPLLQRPFAGSPNLI